jgi:hypothetical protein
MDPKEAKPDRIVFLRARIGSEIANDFGVPMVLLEPVDHRGRPIEGAWTHWVEVSHLVTLEDARAALQRRANRCAGS